MKESNAEKLSLDADVKREVVDATAADKAVIPRNKSGKVERVVKKDAPTSR